MNERELEDKLVRDLLFSSRSYLADQDSVQDHEITEIDIEKFLKFLENYEI